MDENPLSSQAKNREVQNVEARAPRIPTSPSQLKPITPGSESARDKRFERGFPFSSLHLFPKWLPFKKLSILAPLMAQV